MLRLIQTGVGKVVRGVGQGLDAFGKQLEIHPNVDALIPSTIAVKYLGASPSVSEKAFVASSATVVGKVTVGARSSIWYGAVLRGDDNTITIGEDVSVGDRVMIHCSNSPADAPTVIGNRCIVGAGAILHGCVLEDESVVGKGSQVLDGAKVSKHAVLAPGSLLSMGKVVPSGQLWAGVPAVYSRALTPNEIAAISTDAAINHELATVHAEEASKSWLRIEREQWEFDQSEERNPHYYVPMDDKETAKKRGDVEGREYPGRIFNSAVSGKE